MELPEGLHRVGVGRTHAEARRAVLAALRCQVVAGTLEVQTIAAGMLESQEGAIGAYQDG